MLVAVDDSPASRAALQWAHTYCLGISGKAEIEVFTVWTPTERIGPDGFGLIDTSGYPTEAEHLLSELIDDVGVPPNTRAAVGSGRPVESVVRASFGHDLLVIGTRAAGPARQALVGSMSQAVVGRANCPVAIIPEGFPDPGGSTMVAWDGGPGAGAALEWALTHRPADKIRIVFVSDETVAVDVATIEDDIADVFGSEIAQLLDIEVRSGSVCDELLISAAGAAEMVIGDRASLGPHGSIWGSVTSHVLSTTTLPVIVTPARELCGEH